MGKLFQDLKRTFKLSKPPPPPPPPAYIEPEPDRRRLRASRSWDSAFVNQYIQKTAYLEAQQTPPPVPPIPASSQTLPLRRGGETKPNHEAYATASAILGKARNAQRRRGYSTDQLPTMEESRQERK